MEERESINAREAVKKKPQTNTNKRKRKGTSKRKEFFSGPGIPTQLNFTNQNHFIVLQINEATPSTPELQPEIPGAAQSSPQIKKLETSSPKKTWHMIKICDSKWHEGTSDLFSSLDQECY